MSRRASAEGNLAEDAVHGIHREQVLVVVALAALDEERLLFPVVAAEYGETR